MQIHVDKKPAAGSTTWTRIFHNGGVEVYEADKYLDYYKVIKKDGSVRPKYFFGESAWMNTQRFAVDNSDFSAYNIFR